MQASFILSQKNGSDNEQSHGEQDQAREHYQFKCEKWRCSPLSPTPDKDKKHTSKSWLQEKQLAPHAPRNTAKQETNFNDNSRPHSCNLTHFSPAGRKCNTRRQLRQHQNGAGRTHTFPSQQYNGHPEGCPATPHYTHTSSALLLKLRRGGGELQAHLRELCRLLHKVPLSG